MGRLARFIRFYTDEDDGNGGGSAILKTVTGAILHITDALAKPAKKLLVNFEPVQDGEGDPSPENIRPISGITGCNISHTGKNLMGGMDLANQVHRYMPSATIDTTNKYVSFASNGTTISEVGGFAGTGYFKENTQYTFIFTIYKTTGTGSNMRVNYTDGTYDIIPAVSAATTKETKVFVSDSGKTVSRVTKITQSGTTRIYYDESGVFEGVLTADDFEAYKGEMYSFVFPSSKNLYDKSRVRKGAYISESGVIVAFDTSKISDFIPVVAGETYTWSGIQVGDSNNKRVHAYKDGVWQSQITMQSVTESGAFAITFQVPSGVNQIRVSEYLTDTNVQIELGSTATAYEDYTQYYGGTLDVKTGVLTITKYGVDLSQLTWQTRYTGSVNKTISVSIMDAVENALRPSFENRANYILEQYVYVGYITKASSLSNPDNLDIGLRIYHGTESSDAVSTIYLVIPVDASPSGLFVYDLNSVYSHPTYQLTPQQVQMLLGENNLWTDTNSELELEYYADGNVSTLEALNTLLGGRYTNLHTEDDVSDKEALQIILGETT